MPLSVFDVLQRIFPIASGSSERPYPVWPVGADGAGMGVPPERASYAVPPLLPFDVFAAAAHLLEISGAYHHIIAATDGSRSRPAPNSDVRLQIKIDPDTIEDCRREAATWRQPFVANAHEPEIRDEIIARYERMRMLRELWRQLVVDWADKPVFAEFDPSESPPDWWIGCHRLLMIADEACVGVGFEPLPRAPGTTTMPWFEQYQAWFTLKDVASFDATKGLKTLSSADPDYLCVLPKGRTAPVGCTMRSLSHHLAIVPPQGVARGRWHHPPPGRTPFDHDEFNVLLVPYPFEIASTAFRGIVARSGASQNWGFFHVDQSWLPDLDRPEAFARVVNELHNFIYDLAHVAARQEKVSTIHAVIFPELALTERLAQALFFELKETLRNLEVFVTGISDYDGRQGNFVGVYTASEFTQSQADERPTFRHLRAYREKHHRWKLDRTQIESYGLSGGMNPRFSWWEDIDLLSRRVDFTTFRRRSVLAGMICEDLARIDPCQELLRAIGPNLVVALLMDAPQLKVRWPARYATILAEDPGCAVLTLTSKALMNRQHAIGTQPSKSPQDRVISLWRDDHSGENRCLECPDDHQGVLLRLWCSTVTDATLDGRLDEFGKAWTYGTHAPLRIVDAAVKHPGIMTGRW